MRYVSLFSGVEAASVAWEQLGWEPVADCGRWTFDVDDPRAWDGTLDEDEEEDEDEEVDE